MSIAVVDSMWRAVPIVTPSKGFSSSNLSLIFSKTGMCSSAHFTYLSPSGAISISFTSYGNSFNL